MTSRTRDEERRPAPKVLLGFVGSIALWLLAAGGPGDEPVARWVGMLGFHVVAASVIRWLYIRVQRPRPRVVSPTLFLIAAGIALLGRLDQAG